MADAAAGAYVGRNFSSGSTAGRNLSSGAPALVAGLVLYLGLTGILLGLSLARTGGEFVYAQDDPYIHLAMARTLAEHGVWGVRPYEFASASSSPLWTLLLAAIWKLGARLVWVPFALNLFLGCILLVVASRVVTRLAVGADDGVRVPDVAVPAPAVLAALVLVTPLPTLAFIGMEHTLQVLLVLAFVWQAAGRLSSIRDDWAWPAAVAAAMVATRYESLFVVAAVGGLLVWQRRWRGVLMLGVAAGLPVCAFAVYSVTQGGLVLPNSVLMKSGPSRFPSFASGFSAVLSDWIAVGALFRRPAQLALTLAAMIGFLLTPVHTFGPRRRSLWIAACFLGTSLLHAGLVKLEWFYRYEAYLVALGMLSVTGLASLAVLPAGRPHRARKTFHPAVAPLAILLALPLGARALGALAATPKAVGNVYEQQVQLGRFFAKYYAGRPVAVNDLGAVAWIAPSPILDIVGLASQEVGDLKRRGSLTAAALEQLADARGVEVAAVYEDVFASILPKRWVKVGEWKIEGNVAVSGDTVAFFATEALDAERLRRSLASFQGELPPGITTTDQTLRLPARISATR